MLRSGSPRLVIQEAWAWLTGTQLIRASEELYDRVSRIDAGHFSDEPAGSPARFADAASSLVGRRVTNGAH